MCFQEILCDTNDGRIERSCCGNFIKISFFHMVMVYTTMDFHSLYFAMKECYETVRFDSNKHTKCIVFSTPVESMKLRFSVSDIEQIFYLIETSYLFSKTYSLEEVHV